MHGRAMAVEAAPGCSAGVLLLLLISPLHPAAFSDAQGLTGPTGMSKLSKLLGMAMATLAATTMAATTAATGHHHAEACSCPAVAAAAAATMRTVCWLAYLVGLLLRTIICVAHTSGLVLEGRLVAGDLWADLGVLGAK